MMSAKSLKRFTVLMGLALISLPAPKGQAQYEFRGVDFPGAAETVVYGINNLGVMVGQYGDIDFSAAFTEGNRGFVFDGVRYQTIHVPGSLSTSARGINDHGVIVGGYVAEDGQTRGFILDGSEYRDIVTPFADAASAADISNDGHIVGTYSADNFNGDLHGFLFDGSSFQSYDYPDAISTSLAGINDSHQQVGTFTRTDAISGFVLPGANPIAFPNGVITRAMAISDEGQVVGDYMALALSGAGALFRGFRFKPDSAAFTSIILPGPPCTFNPLEPLTQCLRSLRGINSQGTIVGYFDNNDALFHGFVGTPMLRAGDADQNLVFDQRDLIQALARGKYLTGLRATWGEGDWNRAPGGRPGAPPVGDRLFDQFDIIAAAGSGVYLTGRYATITPGGQRGDAQTSVVYDPRTGQLAVDAPGGTELTSIHIDSSAGIFTGAAAQNLGGSFDSDTDGNIFKATFGSSFGSLSFGSVAQPGLAEAFLLGDLTVVGSLAGGGGLGTVDLIWVPEPSTFVLASVALLAVFARSFAHNVANTL
jgi:hypothetical protein